VEFDRRDMSDLLPRIGLRLSGATSPQRCVELARAAEAAGFASLWFAENPFQRGVLPAASACAMATSRMTIGVGVTIPYYRHPTLAAMEFAALDELSGGRAILGLGSGLKGAVARMGLADDRPIAALHDAVAIVRGMLGGETVSYRGKIFSAEGARLGVAAPRRDLPIYLAAMGPQALRLAGRVADGVLISNMVPLAHAAALIPIARDAAEAAGRPALAFVQYVLCSARSDRGMAREAVKPAIAAMLTGLWPAGDDWPPHRDASVAASNIARGEFAEVLARLRRGEPANEVLDDRFVDAFAIAGTAEECLDRARAFRRIGVTELGLAFAGDGVAADIAALGAALASRAAMSHDPASPSENAT
jgi:5,10-methylenetetrahydromethanopterin reductase